MYSSDLEERRWTDHVSWSLSRCSDSMLYLESLTPMRKLILPQLFIRLPSFVLYCSISSSWYSDSIPYLLTTYSCFLFPYSFVSRRPSLIILSCGARTLTGKTACHLRSLASKKKDICGHLHAGRFICVQPDVSDVSICVTMYFYLFIVLSEECSTERFHYPRAIYQ